MTVNDCQSYTMDFYLKARIQLALAIWYMSI
jgi:hypothetical protein